MAAKGFFKCLSANLALQKFMPSIFALLKQLNVCSRSLPSTSFHNVQLSTTKFKSTREVNGQQFRCFLLPSWQIRRLSYQPPVLDEVFNLLRVSRHIYTSGIPEQLLISVYVHTMADSQARLRLRLQFFQCQRLELYGVFQSDNLEKSDRKSILS